MFTATPQLHPSDLTDNLKQILLYIKKPYFARGPSYFQKHLAELNDTVFNLLNIDTQNLLYQKAHGKGKDCYA